jgi:CO/xanthine dehydrogenase FAD-binding subunit
MHDVDAIAEFGQALRELADPLDDVRGSSQYRLQLIPRMVSAAIADVMEPV